MRSEVKVGIFVILGFLSLLYLTFQIKSLEDFKKDGYTIYAIIDDASGIRKKSKVKLRGVNVGEVKDLRLDDNGVRLALFIKKGVKIPKNSLITLAQDNVLGSKYLKILPSNSDEYLKPGEILRKFKPSVALEDVMNNVNLAINDVRELLKKINRTFDENTTKNIKSIFANLNSSSKKLDQILETTKTKIPLLLDNANNLVLTYKKSGEILNKNLPTLFSKANSFLAKLNKTVDIVNTKLPKLADEYIALGENANEILEDNKQGLKGAITEAKNFFADGAKSFKKLDNFLKKAEQSQIEVEITSNYLFKDSDYLTTANIAYKPTPTKSYILGLTSRKDYEKVDENKMYINALLAKRYDNLEIEGGFIQSTAGVGLNYYMLSDRLIFSTSIFDFNSENDPRYDKAHLDVAIKYLYLKHIEFIAGVDNILNSANYFLGVGVKFIDNDLKTLISGGASSFLK